MLEWFCNSKNVYTQERSLRKRYPCSPDVAYIYVLRCSMYAVLREIVKTHEPQTYGIPHLLTKRTHFGYS